VSPEPLTGEGEAVRHDESLDTAQPVEQARRLGGAAAWLNAADLATYRAIRSLARNEETVAKVKRFSKLGEHGAVWLALGAVGSVVDKRRRSRWRKAAVTVGASYLTSTTVKVAIGRQRPVVEDLPQLMATPTGLSFPSSHSTSSFSAARAYGRLLPTPLLYAAAVPMAMSRLYLGVHYPSDILAGAALGTVLGSLGR
jgi:membrane-associated phospholipid phosphatase